MKVLVLVIYSEDMEVYKANLEVWRLYAKSHPVFDVYFITLSHKFDVPTIDGDVLHIPGEESLDNLVYKDVKAFEFFEGRGYDYVLRTNMSSFWIFENLIPVLESLPKERFIGGELVGGDLVSGAGIFLTPDVCDVLIANFFYLNQFQTFWPDDARISHFIHDFFGVPLVQTSPSRFDILTTPDANTIASIPKDTFHIRVKQIAEYGGDRALEPKIMRDLYMHFYEKKIESETH